VVANSTEEFPEEKSLAPSKPQTPFGEMLTYYLRMEPQLFKTALEEQLKKLDEEANAARMEEETQNLDVVKNEQTLDLTLSKRMEEVRANERRFALQDLMYISVLEKFVLLGVDMLPRMDEQVMETETSLEALTQGVHSTEALELVREHVLAVMGQTALAFASAKLKLSKLQMAQIYAASVMFGYFLRGVDKRFQLERALGLISEVDLTDAASRLEKLFHETANLESVDNPDVASSSKESVIQEPQDVSPDQPTSQTSQGGSLRRYVESFDADAMREMAALVSVEGAALVERQTLALFGDVKQLQTEMQTVIGSNVISAEELFKRVQDAVRDDAVSTLVMTVGTQRRAVLEAVAFGTFLRDVERHIDSEYNLLTALPPPQSAGGGPSVGF